MIEMYCDGSSRGNPGKGGWGLVIIKENSIIDKHGQQYEQLVTNNQMELCALLTAIHIASTRY
jgi:ribonuclease HI